jgi:hypothetical protein
MTEYSTTSSILSPRSPNVTVAFLISRMYSVILYATNGENSRQPMDAVLVAFSSGSNRKAIR